ncbi:MAG: cytidylate kinase-like family protein [Dehalococcoidia bacterium]|nr:cytidylate kinase-like family protein [Dehalococcoidia bacterium]
MTVITIEGRLGAGGPDLGRMVAKEMDLDFVDRLMLADIAKKVGSTVSALADQESRIPSLANRFAQAIQRMLHRSAVAGMGGDPYFGPGIEQLLARPYSEMEEAPHTSAEEVDEQHFIDTAAEVINDLANIGNVVILGRGGAAILRDNALVIRVGVVAKMEDRITRVQQQMRLETPEQAESLIEHADLAQHRYFERAFDSSPIDPFLYHFMWNTSDVSLEYAAQVTVDAAKVMSEKGLKWADSTFAQSEPTSE